VNLIKSSFVFSVFIHYNEKKDFLYVNKGKTKKECAFLRFFYRYWNFMSFFEGY